MKYILEINKNIKQNEQVIKNETDDNNNDNESIPILSRVENSYDSVENYYKLNYPEYKIIKIRHFIFVKMGNLLAFNFDKNNNYIPKFSIGPHWYLSLILFLLILFFVFFLYIPIFKGQNLSLIKKIIFFYLLYQFIFLHLVLYLFILKL